MASNRRKRDLPAITVGSTALSGTTAESDNAANADRVTFYIALATITAGDITFAIESSPNDGGIWARLTTGEMLGNTSAISSTGTYHVSAQVPFGNRVRLAYTINTGPAAFLVYPVYERTGVVHN